MNDVCDHGEGLAGLLYDDGDAAEIAEMRAHLAGCADCRGELERLASMKDLLSAWPNAVNAPRMVYVNEPSGFLGRLRRWAAGVGRLHASAFLKPAAAAAAVLLVAVATVAVLDVRVAPDGTVEIGLAGDAAPAGRVAAAAEEAAAPVTREELEEGLVRAVSYMEELLRSRGEEERRLLMAAIDERMQDQGLAMSGQLRDFMDAALTDMERQHENDLGLVFSAIDELGVVTGAELQQMNTILASLLPRGPEQEE